MSRASQHGRGSSENPPNRFERLHLERDPDITDPWYDEDGPPPPQTEYLRDDSRSIIASNDSPDIGFDRSLNPYRGCEHGCMYCYARPFHEYLGFSAGLDFETKIMVKERAPELLRQELSARSWQPQVIQLSGVTDCYQPVERQLRLTRRCLEVLAEFRNPANIITKSALIRRDVDVLAEMARYNGISVAIAITTLDAELASRMEPRAAAPYKRLEAIGTLAEAGIPVGLIMAPILPGLTEHEIDAVLQASSQAGARFATYVVLRLPHGLKELVADWLETHYPLRKGKVLNRVREMRGGKLNEPDFKKRMTGEGFYAEQIRQIFRAARRKYGMDQPFPALSTEHFRVPGRAVQTDLFGS